MHSQTSQSGQSSEASQSTYPEFTPPEGLSLDGDSGEAVVTWKRKPNGNVCITSMDGVAIAGGKADDTDYGAALDEMAEPEGMA